MPELHSLTPLLSVVQENGFNVALVTDGRMSGASGKIPAAIHLYPEAIEAGPIDSVQDGDKIVLDAVEGVLMTESDLTKRTNKKDASMNSQTGFGREFFNILRNNANSPEKGGGINILE